MRIRWQLSILFGILLLVALSGCSKDQGPRPSQGTLDNPGFHVMRGKDLLDCLLYTSPSPRDRQKSRMPSSA